MKTLIAGLVISMAVALIPPPTITVQNPHLLFAAAMYKTAVGDTSSALRLVQRSEQARQSTNPAKSKAIVLQTACDRSPQFFTIL
jgi:hypothetical protein